LPPSLTGDAPNDTVSNKDEENKKKGLRAQTEKWKAGIDSYKQQEKSMPRQKKLNQRKF